jgi:hypothetical protein
MAVQRDRSTGLAAVQRASIAPACAFVSLLLACSVWLVACSSGTGSVQTAGGQAADPPQADFPIFYIRRYSVPTTQDDLRLMRTALPSADVFMRSSASPTGTETNITASVTGTGTANAANYDIKDLSVSYDGTTVLFAMRGPLAKNQQQDKPPFWRIWQYVIATNTLSQVINPATDPDAGLPDVNDVAPHFLPDGRIVFSSTRQTQAQAALLNEGFSEYIAEDEAGTEPAFVLHVMNADGSDIHQISFNASHDRDPSVLMNGEVMWTRWDDPPGKDGMQLYTSNPDGTNLQLLYGANSHQTGPNGTPNADATIEFVKAKEMQNGKILALIRPYTGAESATAPLGTDFGGDLVEIDTQNYVENTQPTLADPSATGPAQTPATTYEVLTIPGPSPGGRFYDGFPLWDGSGRILVSWTQCRLLDTTTKQIVPCTSTALASPTATDAPPLYSVWMFDPSTNTLQPIMQPTDGIMITDVVAAQPRTLPAVILDGVQNGVPGPPLNETFYNANVGAIDVKSVYDFDGNDAVAALTNQAQPNIQALANGAVPATQRPARFIRIETPVPQPDPAFLKLNLPQSAFGVTNYMRAILGYAPVQPDGSVYLQVPANVPFQISILDANAQRIFPTHNAWLQVAPGEVVKCNGCHTPAAQQNPPAGQTAHSHGRQDVFNPSPDDGATTGEVAAGVWTNSVPTLPPTSVGETMAEALSAWSCANDSPPCLQMMPNVEVLYTDVWTNTNGTGLAANPPITYSYTLQPCNAVACEPTPTTDNCVAGWAYNCLIIIDYPDHIQPIWSFPRTITQANGTVVNNTCTSCHAPVDANGNPQQPAGQLDLTNSNPSNTQITSYIDLLETHQELQLVNGVLVPVTQPGPIDPATGLPTQVPVEVPGVLVPGDAHDSTIFFNLLGPNSKDAIHAGLLNGSELRIISEWVDLGAQYFNSPFDAAAQLNNN